jgi:hypothetical protein
MTISGPWSQEGSLVKLQSQSYCELDIIPPTTHKSTLSKGKAVSLISCKRAAGLRDI